MKWSKHYLGLLLNSLTRNSAPYYWTSSQEGIATHTEGQHENIELGCRQLNTPGDNKFALK